MIQWEKTCWGFRNNELTLNICTNDPLRNGFMMALLHSRNCTCCQLELRIDTIKDGGITTNYYM